MINPVGSENVAPWDPSSTYPDTEFNLDFQISTGYSLPNPSPRTNSLSTVAGVRGPLYKWVRINAISEKSLLLDVDADGTKDNSPLYYDSALSKLNTTQTGGETFLIIFFPTPPHHSQQMAFFLVFLLPAQAPTFSSCSRFSSPP